MTIREYLTAIRVTGIKEMSDHNDNEIEDILFNVFLKGTNKRNAARASEMMKPN